MKTINPKNRISAEFRDAVLDDFERLLDKWNFSERTIWSILSPVYSPKERRRTETVTILKKYLAGRQEEPQKHKRSEDYCSTGYWLDHDNWYRDNKQRILELLRALDL